MATRRLFSNRIAESGKTRSLPERERKIKMEKNNEQIKNIWKPLCLVFAALLAFSWVFFGFLYSKGGVDFSTLENPEQNYTASGGAIIGESTGNGVQIMSVQIPAESYVEYGISPMAESAYQLTATVYPATATDKTIDWSVAWSDASASWASGKTVTNYVTVTPTSDGSLTANVACLQAFGAKIKVVASSRENPEITAECAVDYAQRCPSPLFSAAGLSVPNHGLDSDLMSFNKDSKNLTMRLYPDWTETGKRKISFSNTFITYTVSDTFSASYGLRQSQDLKTALSLYGIFGAEYVDVTDDFTPNQELFEFLFEDVYGDSEKMNDLITCLANCDTHYTLEVRIKGKYSKESFDIPLKINTSGFLTSVTSVTFDEEQHIF